MLCNRPYQSLPNYLAVNTAFSITLYAATVLDIAIHMYQCDNDLDECMENSACYFRDYINDVASTAAFYSFAVQSIHHLFAVIFVNNARLQMYQLRFVFCFIQWLVAFLFPVYFIYLYPQLKYDPISYVCVVSEKSSSLLTVYMLIIGFLLPLTVTIGVYIKLFLFVRRLRKPTIVPVLSVKHELIMAKRILLLLAILILGSIPATIFQSLQPPPYYQYRIYYFSVANASLCCLICMFALTNQVKKCLIKWKQKIKDCIHHRKERIIAPQANHY